jgi:hypothetical protein
MTDWEWRVSDSRGSYDWQPVKQGTVTRGSLTLEFREKSEVKFSWGQRVHVKNENKEGIFLGLFAAHLPVEAEVVFIGDTRPVLIPLDAD